MLLATMQEDATQKLHPKPLTPNPRPETQAPIPKRRYPSPDTQAPIPEARNPRLNTRDPKPSARSQVFEAIFSEAAEDAVAKDKGDNT